MKRHPQSTGDNEQQLAARAYRARRQRAEQAQQVLLTILADQHSPDQVRTAAHDLRTALQAATAGAVRAGTGAHTAQRGRRLSPRAWVQPPRQARPWDFELVQLGLIGSWLTVTLLDALGAEPPVVVQPATRAALGPAIAGMAVEPAHQRMARQWQRPVGLDLAASVDAGVAVADAAQGTARAPRVSAHVA